MRIPDQYISDSKRVDWGFFITETSFSEFFLNCIDKNEDLAGSLENRVLSYLPYKVGPFERDAPICSDDVSKVVSSPWQLWSDKRNTTFNYYFFDEADAVKFKLIFSDYLTEN